MVIVVPGTSTLPFGSSPPGRIECDIAESANPATSALWHRPHPLGSMNAISLFVGLEAGAPADRDPLVGVATWVRAVKLAASRSASRPETSEIIRFGVIGVDQVRANIDPRSDRSLQETRKGDKKAAFQTPT
jgi:hypothetical protein